jgi:uncharacterized SAM-binding protein YcdF (DUF218 family)
MFFDKLASLLIYPLGLSLLLGFAGLFLCAFRYRRVGFAVVTTSLVWVTLWSLPPVADVVASSLERQTANLSIELVPHADVILVFGGVMQPPRPDYPYADLGAAADRVWHAARLYHAGKAPTVMLSGGRNDWQADWPSQAQTMAQFLADLGVPLEAMALEERSRSSHENAVYSVELMKQLGLNRALLVTSALHMPRSQALLRTTGVDFLPVATDFEVVDRPITLLSLLPNALALQRSTAAIHEWVGIAVYRWRGWI